MSKERPIPSRREMLKEIKATVKKYRESGSILHKMYIAHLCGSFDWTFQQALDWVDSLGSQPNQSG